MVVPLPRAPLTAALFGKLPSHGDFVARGLSPDARAGWDDWASAGIEAAQTALGEAFPLAHETAPPWRFVLPLWAGAMAASIDSAGRRFVILMMTDKASDAAAQALESAIYDAFARGLDADAAMALAEQSVADIAPEPTQHRWWSPDEGVSLPADTAPQDLFTRIFAPQPVTEVS